MMRLDIDGWLQPVSEQFPCGPELPYDEYRALADMVQSAQVLYEGNTPAPAVSPSWPKMRAAAEAMLVKSRDLRVAGIWYLSLLNTAQLDGLEGGLRLFSELLQRYWAHVHPVVESDGNWQRRVNALGEALGHDDALAALRLVPLAHHPEHGSCCLRSYAIVNGHVTQASPGGEPVNPEKEQRRITAILDGLSPATRNSIGDQLRASAAHMQTIQNILLARTGRVSEKITDLAGEFEKMSRMFGVPLALDAVTQAEAVPTSPASHEISAGRAQKALICNTDDIVRLIGVMCDYYKQHEPSSPVPVVLRRAAALVGMEFEQIIRDFAPDGVKDMQRFGVAARK